MNLREALEKGDVDGALALARSIGVNEALAEARGIAIAPGPDVTRAAATTVMARLAVIACPLPASPATDTAEVMAAKDKTRAAFVAGERATLLWLVRDPSPAVKAAAAAAVIDATEDADLDALRPQLAGAMGPLAQLAATDGDAAIALLRIEGGRAAVPWLAALAKGQSVPVPIDALCGAVARAPVPEALAPLQTLLEDDPLLSRRLRVAPDADSPAADRVRGLTQAIAAIDRGTAVRLAEQAPAEARPFLEEGIVDDAVHRLVTARPEELPAMRAELGGLLPELEARCEAGDVRAIPAALRLGGEPLVMKWLEEIAGGGTAPAPLDELAEAAARLGYKQAAAPLARLVENASRETQESAAWAALLGHDAAAAIRALRVLDPERASALVAAAPAPLRQRLDPSG